MSSLIEKIRNNGKSYFIQTFGCQMNEHDSETIAGMLEEMGYVESPARDTADIIVMNTCSVRENADNRFFGQLGIMKKVRERRPGTVVAVCGCMMQQEHIIRRLKEKYAWVDIIFGTMSIHEFPQLLKDCLAKKEKVMKVYQEQEKIIEGLPVHRKFKHKSFVNIMNGCNNFCTYCIVPYTRGRERSREPEEILAEIRGLVADGVKEVTLLGQNVNSYGNGCGFGCDFAELIRRINAIEGLERIRFMTSHPKDLSDRLIAAFSDCEKLCHHIHLPVQSGSSEVLRRMNRHYTKESYIDLVERIRSAVPDIALTTDIIVGFPGETEADFEDTLDLVRRVRFDSAFTFLYSVRTGTPAAEYEDQIPEEVKHQRFERLVDTLNEITAEKNALYQNRTVEVLVEGESARGEAGTWSGRTDTFKLVNFDCDRDLTGQLVNIRITDAKTFSLFGEVADEKEL
ncbi:MAG: tRNA (N6-isopentenyl adenosine(37)-C2)-methylthiotransferase MiaB [Anaerovoracaceae bacterium]